MSANENPSADAMLDSIAALIREFLVRILRLQQEDPSDSPDSVRRKVLRGYRLCDFQDVWERYLPALPSSRLREIADRAFTPCPIGAPGS